MQQGMQQGTEKDSRSSFGINPLKMVGLLPFSCSSIQSSYHDSGLEAIVIIGSLNIGRRRRSH
jgi:hypothetical protein